MSWATLCFAVFIICLLVAYWKAVLVLLVLYLVGNAPWWGYDAAKRRIVAWRAARRARIARLIAHADREHALVQQGDMAGIYGDYPPPDACRGMGIWMAGDKANGPPKRAAA